MPEFTLETPSPILDLASLTLEVTNLETARSFYIGLLGLESTRYDPERGILELRVGQHQSLRLWKPMTRRSNNERLQGLKARGGTHVHYALQIPKGARQDAQNLLTLYGVNWQEIDLADSGEEPDLGTYFFDPFGHGLELREVALEPKDSRFPVVPPVRPLQDARTIAVVGLREVALAFTHFENMLERLPRAYGFAFAYQMEDRAFGQFTLGPSAEKDGQFTPRRWLYCWDPQVGLADMLGGEHATVGFFADVEAVKARLEGAGYEGAGHEGAGHEGAGHEGADYGDAVYGDAGLVYLHDEHGLAVRDSEGHVFEFIPLPAPLSSNLTSATKGFPDV